MFFLQSTNGVSVNGIRLAKGELFPLKDADVISFIPNGEVRYIFRYIGPTSPLGGAAPANNVSQQQLIPPISPRPSTSSAAMACSGSATAVNCNVVTSGRTESRPSVELIENGNDSEGSNQSESILSLHPPDVYFGLFGEEIARPPSPILSDEDSFRWGPLTKRKLKVDSS